MKRAAEVRDQVARGAAEDEVLRARLRGYFPSGWPPPEHANILHWNAEYRQPAEQCGVWIWPTPAYYLAVLVEFPENRGVSVTNGVEAICRQVQEYVLPTLTPVRHRPTVRFVEHYPAAPIRVRGREVGRKPATWDYVVLREEQERVCGANYSYLPRLEPDWISLTAAQARALVDGVVPDRVLAEEALLALGKAG